MYPFDIDSKKAESSLRRIIYDVHREGAVGLEILEELSHLKMNHNNIFKKYENTIVYLLGLFYKVDTPKDLMSHVYTSFMEKIVEEHGTLYTPMQASILNNISKHNNFTFSAPTSSGKSHLFRNLLLNSVGDIVFIVPTRSLLYEYIILLKNTFRNNKAVFIQQFIDRVNNFKAKRRIFVVTPERAIDIFQFKDDFNISYFVFDEAQISEDPSRGVTFDAFVRRVDKKYPNSKKLFAHPFVENPKAQLKKHGLDGEGVLYRQGVVGKRYVLYKKDKKKFYSFSPFIEKCHYLTEMKEIANDFVVDAINRGEKVLIYIFKTSIVSSTFETNFSNYINLCEEIKNPDALDIIGKIEEFIGAQNENSVMLKLLKKGVVIHHGSIPLMIRSLLEQFTANGYARMCFSTSTLLQGVNMPFDVIWIYNHRFSGDAENRALGLKNLIGRAGRSTKRTGKFDIGTVVVNNAKKFSTELSRKTYLDETSILDSDEKQTDDIVVKELVESVKKNTFNDVFKLPEKRIDRLKSKEVMSAVQYIISELFYSGKILSATEYKKFKRNRKEALKEAFKIIYEKSLGRKLVKGEVTILSKGITILLWQIQGRSFKEILKLRYLYLVDQVEKNKLQTQLKMGEITANEFQESLNKTSFAFSAEANQLPNKNLKGVKNVFKGQKYESFNYDLLVYDTYDYLDKVISYSLSGVYATVFQLYFNSTSDQRAHSMVQFFKYGTNDEVDVMLLRYGFSFEEIEWVKDLIEYINEDEIKFLDSIKECSEEQLEILTPYL